MHAVVTNREMMISLWSAMIARYEGTATLVSVHELIHRPAGWGIGIRACTTHTHEEIS